MIELVNATWYMQSMTANTVIYWEWKNTVHNRWS